VKLRRQLERDAPERIGVRVWLFPWLSYLTIAAMAAVIIAMGFVDGLEIQLALSLVSFAVALGAYLVLARFRARREPALH
jgi:L-asparagine transporter-like permease